MLQICVEMLGGVGGEKNVEVHLKMNEIASKALLKRAKLLTQYRRG